MKNHSWFEVSKSGLRKLIEDRNKAFIIYELLQNAWDERATSVDVMLKPATRGHVLLTVEDDSPDGFADLTHAYRMFEESKKKGDPEKRGRFNVGEKLFLALCDQAEITSTTGRVNFLSNGTRTSSPEHTDAGTQIIATLPMTKNEYLMVCEEVGLLLPPGGIATTFNGQVIPVRAPRTVFEATLPTVIADDFGVMRKTTRKTRVEIHEVADGEVAHIYEMGIPIVPTGDRFHVNVMQKVPLNTDRDNVLPAYLRQLRTEVLNATFDSVHTEEQAGAAWVRSALADERVTPEAVKAVVIAAFGEKALIADLSDPEANSTAVSEGYRVIHGGTFTREQWANIRKAEALAPTGQVFPTPKPYGDDPDAPSAETVPEADYTDGMRDVVALTKVLSQRFLRHGCSVRIVKANGFGACHIGHPVGNFTEFHFNVQALGKRWFDLQGNLGGVLSMMAHEFAHDAAGNHLDAAFFKSIERFAGWVAVLMRDEPEVFAPSKVTATV
jgi:hypothetical protein